MRLPARVVKQERFMVFFLGTQGILGNIVMMIKLTLMRLSPKSNRDIIAVDIFHRLAQTLFFLKNTAILPEDSPIIKQKQQQINNIQSETKEIR